MKNPFVFALCLLAASVAAAGPAAQAEEVANPFARIGHIVVIFTENRSFDHVFGLYPGADGIAAAAAQGFLQLDADGSPLPGIPAPRLDDRFPERLPNAPFPLDAFVGPEARTADPVHDFFQEQEQIDGGKMDRFVEASNVGALTMAYADGRRLKQWALAREFTLADHFFHGAFGGSFLNHIFLVCACAPLFPHPPEKFVAKIDETTKRLLRAENSPKSVLDGPPRFAQSGRVTPESAYGAHYAVSTLQPERQITPFDTSKPEERLPAQQQPTIGDRLNDKSISWSWFSGGWNDVVAGRTRPYDGAEAFQTHHQPFVYFAAYAPGEKKREEHLKDEADFFAAIEAGRLPAVSFYKPVGVQNGHPGYSDLAAGDAHVGAIVDRLRAGPDWKDMLIIVTADENGGFWDHVAPPKGDRFGPGSRVPAVIISPFARKGYIDRTVYDTSSILKTIEIRFGLAPLTARDAAANDLRNALESPH